MSLSRRSVVGLLAGAGALGVARNPGHAELSAAPPVQDGLEYTRFRARFISGGRTIDTGNGNTSHTEGQGWAMLMAEAHDDQATFDRVLTWTLRELRRPHDALHAWRWTPGRPVPIADYNNATDGDIFIVWALLRAARRWQRPELEQRAHAICADLERLCIREMDGRTLLLPAASGFEHRDHLVINPSYYVFPAFVDFAALRGPESPWMRLHRDGLLLMREARFGRWALPADWVRLPRSGARVAPASGWVPRFSYDAVRVPLYLAWGGMASEPAAQAAAAFFAQPGTPAWTEFQGDKLAPYAMNSGQRAVARLVSAGAGAVDLPSVEEAQDYYGAALTMLVRMAMNERLPLST
jgi:endoglucanase